MKPRIPVLSKRQSEDNIFNTLPRLSPEVGYSVRKLLPDYNGDCMKIRRSSDDAELDIGFNEYGWLDEDRAIGFTKAWVGREGLYNSGLVDTYGVVPDSSELQISSDIELTARIRHTGAEKGYILGKWDTGSSNRCYALNFDEFRKIRILISHNGNFNSNSSLESDASIPELSSEVFWIKGVVDFTASTTTYYYSELTNPLEDDWIQLGTPQSITAGGINQTTVPLYISGTAFDGTVEEGYNGAILFAYIKDLTSDEIVFEKDFTKVPRGNTRFLSDDVNQHPITVVTQAGVSSEGLALNGVDGNNVSIPNDASFNRGSGTITISGSVNIDDIEFTGNTIFDNRNQNGGSPIGMAFVYINTSNVFRLAVFNGSAFSVDSAVHASGDISYSCSVSPSTISLTVNGVTTSIARSTAVTDTSSPIFIGQKNSEVTSSNSNFTGLMYDFSLSVDGITVLEIDFTNQVTGSESFLDATGDHTVTINSTADSAYVTTWYDQSGNGDDVTQATANLQPRIIDSGAVSKVNSVVGLDFSHNIDVVMSGSITLSTPYSASIVARAIYAGGISRSFFEVRIDGGTNETREVFTNNGTDYVYIEVGGTSGNVLPVSSELLANIIVREQTQVSGFQNRLAGDNNPVTGYTSDEDFDIIYIGNDSTGGNNSDKFSEFIIFDSVLNNTDIQLLQSNQIKVFNL